MINREAIKERLGSKTLLFVDDEVEIVEGMKRVFMRYFGDVVIAGDGEEGLEQFEAHSIDMVVSDISMPKLDGVKMGEQIRKKSSLPIVFVTGHSENFIDEVEAMNGRIMHKPVDLNELLNLLYELAGE
jgi:DNA-binding response OmpR family regulator